MNIPAITVTIDTTEAIKALSELEAAIDRVEAALNKLTASETSTRNVSVNEMMSRVDTVVYHRPRM